MKLTILLAAALSFSAVAKHVDRATLGKDTVLFPTTLKLQPLQETALVEFERFDGCAPIPGIPGTPFPGTQPLPGGPIPPPTDAKRNHHGGVTVMLDLTVPGDALIYQALLPVIGKNSVRLSVDSSGNIGGITIESGFCGFPGPIGPIAPPPAIGGCVWVAKTYYEPVTTYVEGKPVTKYVERTYYECVPPTKK